MADNILVSALDFLGRPGRALAGGVRAGLAGEDPLQAAIDNALGRREDTFSDVLEDQGASGLPATLAGLGLDLVLDPVNLIPGGALVKGAKLAGRAARASTPVRAALETGVGRSLSELGAATKQQFGRTFISDAYGLPEDLIKGDKIRQVRLHALANRAEDQALKQFGDLTEEQGKDVLIAAEHGRQLSDPREARALADWQTLANSMRDKELAAGVLNPERVKEHYATLLRSGEMRRVLRIPEISGTNRFNRPRDTGLEHALAQGKAVANLAKVAAVRMRAGERAVINTEFVRDVASRYGMALPDDEAAELLGLRKAVVQGEEFGVRAALKDTYFDPEIASFLERSFVLDQDLDGFKKVWAKVTGTLKRTMTVVKPGFAFQNLGSNMWQMHLGGMPVSAIPKYLSRAGFTGDRPWDMGRNWAAKVAKNPDEMIGGRRLADIDTYMRDVGITGMTTTGILGDIHHGIESSLDWAQKSATQRAASRLNPFSEWFAPSALGGHMSAQFEDVSKRALFLWKLEDLAKQGVKGPVDLDTVTHHTYDYLFNYFDLTRFEKRVMKNVMPFYTWTRKNLPLQLRSLASEPHKFARLEDFVQAFENEAERAGVRLPTGFRPSYIEDDVLPQLPFDGPDGTTYYLDLRLPHQDLSMVPTSTSGALSSVRDLVGMMHPVLKAPIELAANRNVFLQRPIYSEDRRTGELRDVPADAVGAGLHALGLGGLAGTSEVTPAEALAAREAGSDRQAGDVMQHPLAQYGLSSMLPVAANLGRPIAGALTGQEETVPGLHGLTPSLLAFITGVRVRPVRPSQLNLEPGLKNLLQPVTR